MSVSIDWYFQLMNITMRATYIENEQEKRKHQYNFDRLTYDVRYLHEMLAKPSDTKFEY